MVCRVCNKEIDLAKYCYSCGWMNGQVDLLTKLIKINKAEGSGIITFENRYVADVRLDISLEDNTGLVSFDNGNGTIEVCGGKTEDVKFKFDINKIYTNNFRFNLNIESNDDSPLLNQKINTKGNLRPYEKEHKRRWEREISVEVLEPGKLEFDKHMIIFDNERDKRVLYISNIGNMDLVLTRSNFNTRNEFEVIFENDESEITLKAGESIPVSIKILEDGEDELYSIMPVYYKVGDEKESQDIILFRRKVIHELPPVLFDNIIAIDFGTAKTAAAYLDILALYDLDHLSKYVTNIKLDKDSYEVKSCIAYRGKNTVYIGQNAIGFKDFPDADYVDSMKMHLHKSEIEMRKKGDIVIKKNARDVITRYLKEIRKKILENNIKLDNSKFVFTLPVLDDDKNGELYESQKAVTLKCAQDAGFGDIDSIQTVKEPEAAMYYIINSIKENPEKWRGCDIKNNEKICVFDYGGGTLDICFGTYTLVDNKPTVCDSISIGKYFDNNKHINLGGNRLDNRMAYSICKSNGKQIIKNKNEDENGFFSVELDKSRTSLSWVTIIDASKERKENISKNWNNNDYDELKENPIISNDDEEDSIKSGYLTKEIFSDVVLNDLDYAIEGMKKIIEEENINNLKYIFMVGGTSLIHIIKEKLHSEFPGVRVLNAFDFSSFNEKEEYDKIRESSVYSVVRGAAISYVTTISNIFSIDLRIAPFNHQENYIQYKKGEYFSPIQKNYQAQVGYGEWIIKGSVDGQNYYKLGSFHIKKIAKNTPLAISVMTKVLNNRELKIFFREGRNNPENEIMGIEVYV